MASNNTSASSFKAYSSSSQVDVPVLIVGAGPSGLLSALLLSKMGVPCRIIERQLGASPLSKALVIHARTLEIFQMIGFDPAKGEGGKNELMDKFLDEGLPLSDFHFYSGGRLASVLPVFKNKDSFFNYGLFIEQGRTVALLSEELAKYGVCVDHGWELMDTKVVENRPGETDTYVETTIRRAKVGSNFRNTESKVLGSIDLEGDQAGKEYEVQVVRSNYLIATDGGKSAVRHKLNINFPGKTLDNNIILYDGHINTNITLRTPTIIDGTGGRTIIAIPLSNGRTRIMLDRGMLTPEGHKNLDPEELTFESFKKMLTEVASPITIELLDCQWLTYYRVNERLAERFSDKRRIFLAGDAAHVHSPAGGQGMNMGLQDAHNLTWKIALVLKGAAPESLLDTYSPERHAVAENIISLTSNLLGVGMAQDTFRRLLRRAALTVLPYILPLMSQGSPISMLRVRYHENNINQRHPAQPAPAEEYQVGQRARDGDLYFLGQVPNNTKSAPEPVHSLSSIRLHQLLAGPGVFHVLVFASDILSIKGQKQRYNIPPRDLLHLVSKYLTKWNAHWSLTYPAVSALPGASSTRAPIATLQKTFMVHILTASSEQSELASSDVESLGRQLTGEGRGYLDKQGVIHQKYGVNTRGGTGSIVVLRPDSYIGFRVQGIDEAEWKDVDEYFCSVLINREQQHRL
ncbi:hypothetical protein BGW38_008638 [Lunasporangiospora selenospora]|uniref:FAD-binding domain-containing protein n=1 Tax=Lunasporangiospora selenospora TaxID=979761 RepID=A0A9P6G3I7_9FUNG|nr:hypothetical protein BGW38_008638 [Lunasporangiospora selenospora]